MSAGDRARATTRPVVLLNDRLIPAARATIAALDRGFLYGDGLFETVRAYARPAVRARSRTSPAWRARLASSAFPFDAKLDALAARASAACSRANRLDDRDAAVRLTISRGAGRSASCRRARCGRRRCLIATAPLDARLGAAQIRGVGACFFPFRLVTATLPSHKTLHYLPAVLGKMIAERRRGLGGASISPPTTPCSKARPATSSSVAARDGLHAAARAASSRASPATAHDASRAAPASGSSSSRSRAASCSPPTRSSSPPRPSRYCR